MVIRQLNVLSGALALLFFSFGAQCASLMTTEVERQVHEFVSQQLQDAYHQHYVDHQIEFGFPSRVQSEECPKGSVSVSFPPNMRSVNSAVMVCAVTEKRSRFKYRVKPMLSVLVPEVNIQSGIELSPVQVGSKVVETRVPNDFLLDLKEGQYRAKRRLNVGSPIRLSQLETRPTVVSGQVIEFVVTRGSVSVRTRVEVLEDGMIGEFVWVRNVVTDTTFLARVTLEGSLDV
ncbi:flagella basal body P-ring formation protein FlgA [Vibrio breoganii]|nr:flagella basal body P-ring formation protein FlgA [Vibrio breoganii]